MNSLICSVQDVKLVGSEKIYDERLQLNIEESVSYALLSGDSVWTNLLQNLAGVRTLPCGRISYSDQCKKKITDFIQYVPDDVICYTNMKVEDYLCGIALATSRQRAKEAGRLCGRFGIDIQEELLNLTFEQNRIVAMIQALVREPKLFLLDHPHDMLSHGAYLLLLEEILKRQEKGMTVIVAAEEYSKVGIPCDKYLFFDSRQECMKQYVEEELPRIPKIITMSGGEAEVKEEDIIFQKNNQWRFFARKWSVKEIAKMLFNSGCFDFLVEEPTMEEVIFGDYERWLA